MQPEQPIDVYARAAAAACAHFRPGSQASASAENYAASAWFRAAVDAAVADGLRQATEGWERQVAVQLVEYPDPEPPYPVDDEDHARWMLARGYATAVLYRRVGPWEPAEQPEPAGGAS